jgi:hypothetical protein
MHRSIRLTIALLAALPAGVAAQQAQQLSIEEALRLASDRR